MGKENPLVSVIMATYNEPPDMIKNAIESILNQTYKTLELLIFDDSTNEKTKKVIDYFAADMRVKVFRSSERIGFVPSLNKGLEAAQGAYIARMDGDDFSLPERFEKEVAFLESHPEISVVGGQMDIMDEKGMVISHRKYPTSKVKLFFFSCYRNPLGHPTIMMRREVVDQGYRYNEKLAMSEDLDFWLRLMNDGHKLANIEDTVLKYRVQENFIDKRTSEVQRHYMADVRKANFDKRRTVHGILSCCSGWLFTHVSVNRLIRMYSKENKA